MTASDRRLTLYAAFSEVSGGGSVAGVVGASSGLSTERMQQIAAQVGVPATCFVTNLGVGVVDVRFFSTLTEYPMCGHGTIAVFTWLVEENRLIAEPDASSWALRTPGGMATVDVAIRADGRPEVMLALEPTVAEPCPVDATDVASPLGIQAGVVIEPLGLEVASSDFSHLVVRVDGLGTIVGLSPDYAAITDLCRHIGADTLAVFTTETNDSGVTIRCRDFCPAVGTPEAAATGTTNRALTSYLVRNKLAGTGTGSSVVVAAQGLEMGRPSLIRTEVTMVDGLPTRLYVGGVATRVSDETISIC